MPIFRTFAKRKEESAKAGKPTIYGYASLPEGFRAQVVHILRDTICNVGYLDERNNWWCYIHDTLAREMGVFDLVPGRSSSRNQERMQDCLNFLVNSEDVDQVLSLIEISFHFIDTVIRDERHNINYYDVEYSQTPDDAIKELNERFQEHAIGYQFLNRQIVKISSQYLHSQVVENAVTLMYENRFENALQEFMDAHKNYRERNSKEAISCALNSFESTMKIICDRMKWPYSQNDTASKLVTILFDNNLVPPQLQSHFSSLRATLEGGVPTVRNNFGGHGQGVASVHVPDHLVAYTLHLTASNIVFLIQSYNSLTK